MFLETFIETLYNNWDAWVEISLNWFANLLRKGNKGNFGSLTSSYERQMT